MRIARLSLPLLLFCVLLPLTAGPIVIGPDSEELPLAGGLLYRLDGDSRLGPDQVAAEPEELRPLPRRSIAIPRDGVLWLSFSVLNSRDTEEWILENTMNAERMELYIFRDGVWIPHQASGNAIPFDAREFKTRKPAFELPLAAHSVTPVLLRVSDFQSASVQLLLKSRAHFRSDYLNGTLLLGLAFGFFLALIIYNLLVYAISRDRLYLIYALYMIAFSLNQAAQERLITQYVEPYRPYGFFWFVLFGGATVAFGLEFFRAFIDTPRRMPRLDRGMRGLFIAGSLISISAFFHAGPLSADLLNLISIAAMGLIVWALAIRIMRGDGLALVCLAGSVIYLLGTAVEILSTFIDLPVTPFMLSAQLYGALLQVLMLGFALGGRNRRLRLEYDRIQEEFRRRLEATVRERTAELEQANLLLSESAVTDPLTGLYNRGALAKRIEELDTARRRSGGEPEPLSAAYLDLDNFKYFNDTFGHKYGDRILIEAAGILRETLRGDDLLFRMGGDEFLILMPGTDAVQAERAVRRLLDSFELLGSRLEGAPEARRHDAPSISIGLASSTSGKIGGVEELIQRADEALLNAKESGKNRHSVA